MKKKKKTWRGGARTFRSLNNAPMIAWYGELLLAEKNGSVAPRFRGQQRPEIVVPRESAIALVAAVVEHEPQTRCRFAVKIGHKVIKVRIRPQ